MERAPGAYPVRLAAAWSPGWDPHNISDLADDIPPNPNIWTDGSMGEDLDAMVVVAGAGAFVRVFDGRAWRHAQDLDLDEDATRIFPMVPGPGQTVQRAEYLGAILALQAFIPLHLGIDNKSVCSNIGQILSGWTGTPFCLCTVGYLLSCIDDMVRYRSAWSVKVSRSKVMPLTPWLLRVKFAGKIRMVMMLLILRLILAGFDNLLWLLLPGEICSGSKKSGIPGFCPFTGSRLLMLENLLTLVIAMFPLLTLYVGIVRLGPRSVMSMKGFSLSVDISLWPFSVPMLVKFTSFLSTLRWPQGLNEMGKFRVSYLEILVLFEQWVVRRLLPEKAVPKKNRPGRNLFLGTSTVSEGVRIRIACQFVGNIFRGLVQPPGGLHRFVPGKLGPHLRRLRHFGWLQCGHGLTCRHIDSCMPGCDGPVLDLLGYPAGSATHLANGTLKL